LTAGRGKTWEIGRQWLREGREGRLGIGEGLKRQIKSGIETVKSL